MLQQYREQLSFSPRQTEMALDAHEFTYKYETISKIMPHNGTESKMPQNQARGLIVC